MRHGTSITALENHHIGTGGSPVPPRKASAGPPFCRSLREDGESSSPQDAATSGSETRATRTYHGTAAGPVRSAKKVSPAGRQRRRPERPCSPFRGWGSAGIKAIRAASAARSRRCAHGCGKCELADDRWLNSNRRRPFAAEASSIQARARSARWSTRVRGRATCRSRSF